MAFWDKNTPVIMKEDSSSAARLAALESLRGTLPPATEARLESDIKALKAGIAGEERILYELRNSHMDMFVLHDLFLEHEGLTAQIDFLVITLQRIFVLECKNLYGDIEVNERGEFVRNMGGRREGIYSPITQNQRHIELIHAMKREDRSFLHNLMVDGDFDDIYRGLVVLANPKTRLKDRYATKEVRDKIIRADQLVETMRVINDEKGAGREKVFRSAAQNGAEWFLNHHKDNPVDYAARYRAMAEREQAGSTATEGKSGGEAAVASDCHSAAGGCGSADAEQATSICCPKCGAPMVLRVARRGARAGKRFYGCSNYPHCRGIVNIDE